VQGVGFERLAAGFPGHAHQRAPTEGVDRDRGDNRCEGERIRMHGRAVGKPEDRPIGDAAGEQQEKTGLRERGDGLDLGVSERVAFVGGLVGDPHSEIRERREADIERIVRALGDEGERAGESAGDEFQCSEPRAGGDRQRRRSTFGAGGAGIFRVHPVVAPSRRPPYKRAPRNAKSKESRLCVICTR
jgi:hypothetical protein